VHIFISTHNHRHRDRFYNRFHIEPSSYCARGAKLSICLSVSRKHYYAPPCTRPFEHYRAIDGCSLVPPNGRYRSLLQCCLRTWHLVIFGQNVGQRSDRRDLVLVDLPVALCIMILDVLKFCRILECRVVPVQMPHPLVKVGIPRSDVSDVALEVLHVDGIKTHDCSVEANVGFRDLRRGEQIRRR
jgi:hypothetical protein